jgi:hypothetical protein
MILLNSYRWVPLVLVCLLAACTSPPVDAPTQPETAGAAESLGAQPLPEVTPADLQFTEAMSTPVISRAQKFILPVPALAGGGEALIYPPDHPQAGQPVLDWQGNPIGERGLIFYNYADESVQAVPGDGSGVIIMNEVTAEQAAALHDYISTMSDDPTQLTIDQLKTILDYAQTDLGLGDRYNSTRAYIQENMVPLALPDGASIAVAGDDTYGFKGRNDQEVLQAVYIANAFQFQGPAATPQVFEQGGVIVKEADEFRGIQPDIFRRTYTLRDGRAITDLSQDLATQTPF